MNESTNQSLETETIVLITEHYYLVVTDVKQYNVDLLGQLRLFHRFMFEVTHKFATSYERSEVKNDWNELSSDVQDLFIDISCINLNLLESFMHRLNLKNYRESDDAYSEEF